MPDTKRPPQTPTIRVMSTLALATAVRELGGRFQDEAGVNLVTDFAPTHALLNRIRSGEVGDLAILTSQGIEQLIDQGVLAHGSRVDVALSSLAIAVKAGAPRRAMDTVADFKSVLLEAQSIAYSRIGASGIFFADLIERLGISEQVNAKAKVIPSGFTAELVASGEAELAIQQVSELLAVSGVDIMGRLPAGIQCVTTFAAGLFSGSVHPEQANRFAQMLSSPESAPILRSSGLDPLMPV